MPTCNSTPAPQPDFVCVNGTYYETNSTTIHSLNLTVPLQVDGNFTIENDNSTLTIAYNGVPVLNISGIADLHGTLVLVVNGDVKLSAASTVLVGYATTLQSQFSQVLLQSSNQCIEYSTSALQYDSSDSSLSVLVESSSNVCDNHTSVSWWIYLLAVLGALLLIGVLILLAFVLGGKRFFRPLWRQQSSSDVKHERT